MNYGNTIKNLRNNLALSQQSLADLLNIARQTYNHYEVQENVIPLKHLNILANYFNVSIDYILNLTTEKKYVNNKEDINKNIFCQRLKEFRKENKITLEKLASNLNTNKSVICNYERGRNLISTSFLYEICSKYKISADYLLGKINEPKYLK